MTGEFELKLLLNALIKYIAGFILIAALLFLPAGTFKYTNGWLFIGLLFIPMLILGVVLLLKAPGLLQKRLNAKEKQDTQKGIVAFSALIFLVGFILAGLDFRFAWTKIPLPIVIAGAVILLASYALYGVVMKQNEYLSRIIEVQEGQKVIDTGLYGIVRHPMYTATIFLFLSIPIVLSSWVSLAVFALYPVVIVVRVLNEEKVLAEGLPGYVEYMKKVKYRLIPFVW
ncbi:MAG: isoprenylcysteine carboxylmethyltransferase family protein [Ruminococcaceae bacterium]|nr:isoprenylcysteine carboxylmethyltransferase family protein [Oscillospiraceae bacterium]